MRRTKLARMAREVARERIISAIDPRLLSTLNIRELDRVCGKLISKHPELITQARRRLAVKRSLQLAMGGPLTIRFK